MSTVRKILIPVLLLCVSFVICACSQKNDYLSQLVLSPNDKSINELVSTVYSDADVSVIAGFRGDIETLSANYPIECIRQVEQGYRVAYLGEGSVVLLTFDSSGDNVISRLLCGLQAHDTFEELQAGQSLDHVRDIDPNGSYLFLYTGRNDTPSNSFHCTHDGYLVTIEYDSNNQFESIRKSLI